MPAHRRSKSQSVLLGRLLGHRCFPSVSEQRLRPRRPRATGSRCRRSLSPEPEIAGALGRMARSTARAERAESRTFSNASPTSRRLSPRPCWTERAATSSRRSRSGGRWETRDREDRIQARRSARARLKPAAAQDDARLARGAPPEPACPLRLIQAAHPSAECRAYSQPLILPVGFMVTETRERSEQVMAPWIGAPVLNEASENREMNTLPVISDSTNTPGLTRARSAWT